MKSKRGRNPGTPKTGGRKKGTPNKSTAQLRDSIQVIVENNINKLQDDLAFLKPFDRIKAVTELTKFVLPTLKAVELSGDAEKPIVIVDLGNGINPDDNDN